MVPRVDIVAIEVDTPFEQVIKSFVEQGHSRVPVYRETLDDVLGMVHVKDVLPYAADNKPMALAKILRKVLFVAPSMPVLDLLLQMRLTRIHLALVVDEFGGVDGLLSIEDVIEEIVGEIEDEHDPADPPQLIERPDGSVIVEARMPIDRLEDATGQKLLPAESEEEINTLGGLVTTLAGRVPTRGEVIKHPAGFDIEVLDADPRRVKRLRLRGLPVPPPVTEVEHA
jgi:CBS domain containing-hemolysin-like protein